MTGGMHQGKVTVITGGGRGFGKAFEMALAACGAHVVLADIDGTAAEAAAEEIADKGGSASAAAVPGLSRGVVRDRRDAARHRRLRALGLTGNAHRKEPARA